MIGAELEATLGGKPKAEVVPIEQAPEAQRG